MTSGKELVQYSALTAGLFWSENNPKKYLDEPISTVLNGVIYGSLYSYGASLVADKLPEKGKYIFAGLIVTSGLYFLGKGIYNSYYGLNSNEKSNKIQLINITYNNEKL